MKLSSLYSTYGDCFDPLFPDSFLRIYDGTDEHGKVLLTSCVEEEVDQINCSLFIQFL